MIKWSKPNENGQIFAQVHEICIGYVRLVAATEKPEYEWELVAVGHTTFTHREGSCKTRDGAKKALAANWSRFCYRLNLIQESPGYRNIPEHKDIIDLGRYRTA